MSTRPARRGPDVVAAGAVVVRRDEEGHRVLLVHRPRYDDWSLPKGKRDRGEHLTTCAVREVQEETGFRVALGVPLTEQRYPLSDGRQKVVHYWTARVRGDADAPFVPNDEVDEVRWVPWEAARELLTHHHDRTTLDQAEERRRRTRTVLVVRHAEAMPRADFADSGEPDAHRPLTDTGRRRAQRLVSVLDAYAPQAVVSSDALRCVGTLAPYAAASGRRMALHPELGEEESTPREVTALLERLVGENRRSVVCSHRPVLPWILQALGVGVLEPSLAKGEVVALHLRRGEVVALERHTVDL